MIVEVRRIEAEVDGHVFISVTCVDRPHVSLDLRNVHGRRILSVCVDGMGIGSMMVDVAPSDPLSTPLLKRFCPFCGVEINLVSSSTHVCGEEPDASHRC